MTISNKPVALVTGAARRVGASIARKLSQDGYRIALHYRESKTEAETIATELNKRRDGMCELFPGDLADKATPEGMVDQVVGHFGRLDLLVNNASSFYPTPIGQITQEAWDDLFSSNARGPLFMSQRAVPFLRERSGAIVNIIDIHGETPMRKHTVYCMAKAALAMMTRALAKDLAPDVRVNGVAPGVILWPEGESNNDSMQDELIRRVPMARPGDPDDIAQAVAFLAAAPYITGQILAVDGGRTLNM